MAITRPEVLESKINYLVEELYDHYLREAGDYNDPKEWHEIATAVANRFKNQIEQSEQRNMDLTGQGCRRE